MGFGDLRTGRTCGSHVSYSLPRSTIVKLYRLSLFQVDWPYLPMSQPLVGRNRRKRYPISALVWAIRAISLSTLGRQAGDEDLVQTSRRVYGKSLLK